MKPNRRRGLVGLMVAGLFMTGAAWAQVPDLFRGEGSEVIDTDPFVGPVGVTATFDSETSEVLVSIELFDGGAVSMTDVEITIASSGIVSFTGPAMREATLTAGEPLNITIPVTLTGSGEGELAVFASTSSSDVCGVAGAADSALLFFAVDDAKVAASLGSTTDARVQLEAERLAEGFISEAEYQDAVRSIMVPATVSNPNVRAPRLTEADMWLAETRLIPMTANAAAATSHSRGGPQVAVNGTFTYAGVSSADPSMDNVRPVIDCVVELFDRDGAGGNIGTLLGTVNTAVDGTYTINVPQKRADGVTNVVLAVILWSENSEADVRSNGTRHGVLIDVGELTDTSAREASFAFTDSNATFRTANRAFSILDCLNYAATGYRAIVSATGAGLNPAQVDVTFPNPSGTGSFHPWNTNDLTVGATACYAWDTIMHEFGHYIDDLNGLTLKDYGGFHSISWANLTGQTQPLNGGASRIVSKELGLKLAYGESFATWLGTSIQQDFGLDGLGLLGVGDTRYSNGIGFRAAGDRRETWGYDVENNAEATFPSGGEDSEGAVQRLFWDFKDANMDGDDEVAFGTAETWRIFNSASIGDTRGGRKPATFGEFYSILRTRTPPTSGAVQVGNANKVQMLYGSILEDHLVGTTPLAPAKFSVPEGIPTFRWETDLARHEGIDATKGYHADRFKVEFYNRDFSTKIFEKPMAADLLDSSTATTEWTPTMEEWDMIRAGDSIIHWVVVSEDTFNDPTGPTYYGQHSTIGAVDIALVIDDTGSMGDDIDGVKASILAFIDLLEDLGLAEAEQPNIQVTTFKDGVSQLPASNDLEVIRSQVNALFASGGGDCPEASGQAILEAAKNLPAAGAGNILRGTMYIATDASPHRGYDLDGIRNQLRAKGIRVITGLSGDCISVRADEGNSSANCDSCDNETDDRGMIMLGALPSDTLGTGALPSARLFAADLALGTGGVLIDIVGGEGENEQVNTLVNALLAAFRPTVVGLDPYTIPQGSSIDVAINGLATNFTNASTVSFAGSGITVNSVTAVSPTQLIASINIAADAEFGTRDVTVTTPLAGAVEEAVGFGATEVGSPITFPTIISVQPNIIREGQTTTVSIRTLNTTLTDVADLALTFEKPVVVSNVVVASDDTVMATISAPLGQSGIQGLSDLTLSGSDEFSLSRFNALTITLPESSEGDSSLLSVSPSQSLPGTSLTVTITGNNTNFCPGISTVQFTGTGISVGTVNVMDSQTLTAALTISSGAESSFRDVIVETGPERVILLGGFFVGNTGGGSGGNIDFGLDGPAGYSALGITGASSIFTGIGNSVDGIVVQDANPPVGRSRQIRFWEAAPVVGCNGCGPTGMALSVNPFGVVSGIATVEVRDILGVPDEGFTQFALSRAEVPVKGRVRYKAASTSFVESDGDVSTTTNWNNPVGLRGAIKTVDGRYAFAMRGSERFTRTFFNGAMTGQSGPTGFYVNTTARGGDFASGRALILINGWVPDMASILVSRDSFTANSKLTRWVGDARVFTDLEDTVIDGGITRAATRYFNVERSRPGRASINSRNGVYRSALRGYLMTTFGEASEAGFNPSNLDIRETSSSFRGPGASSTARARYESLPTRSEE